MGCKKIYVRRIIRIETHIMKNSMLKMSALHIIVILTLVPALTLAGGKHETKRPSSPPGDSSSHTSLPVPQIPITPPNVPQPPTSPLGGNNGQIYCSGPTAPGWRVSLPNGGCMATSVPLRILPNTGYNPTPWEYIVDLLSAVWHMIYL